MGNSISQRVERAQKTGVFSLEQVDVSSVPPEIFQLKNLRVLDLSKNSISSM